jgi:hypothetical protein
VVNSYSSGTRFAATEVGKITGNTKAGVRTNYMYSRNPMLRKQVHVFLSPEISRDGSYPKPVKSTSMAYFYCTPQYVSFRFSN